MTQMPRREGEILINGQRRFAWFSNGEYHCEPCMTEEEFKKELLEGLRYARAEHQQNMTDQSITMQ